MSREPEDGPNEAGFDPGVALVLTTFAVAGLLGVVALVVAFENPTGAGRTSVGGALGVGGAGAVFVIVAVRRLRARGREG